MKKILSLTIVSLACAQVLMAQDTYMNDLLTNTSDINGTARYVGMGGATGALGGDISGISNNPAGIGGFNRSWASIGMGAKIQTEKPLENDARAHYSFDQIGFVVVLPRDGGNRLNFALNLQQNLSFNRSFMAENKNLGGLSQAAQFAHLSTLDFSTKGALPYCTPYMGLFDVYRPDGSFYAYRANDNSYYNTTSGKNYALDFNVSGAVNNRIFWGATFGLNFVNYQSEGSYAEFRDGFAMTTDADNNITSVTALENNAGGIQDYTLEWWKKISGVGFNFKVGTIISPIEDNPFRFGLAIETPTWYTMKQKDTYWTVWSKFQNTGNYFPGSEQYMYDYSPNDYVKYDSPDDNYLEFNVRSPWKFRFSLADVHAGIVAWDVEYEYSLNNYVRSGYPTYESDSWGGQSTRMDSDKGMNGLTKNIARGVHNIRAGLEVQASDHFTLRAGYNFYSSPFKNNARFDQTINSFAMNKVTGTEFLNLGATNIFSFGIGYHVKGFYANAAYKYRMQKGDFYAFDDSYQSLDSHENQFITETSSLRPVSCSLDRHDITFTLGYEF